MFIYDWGVLKWTVRNLTKITSKNYENIKSHIAYVKIRIAVDNMCYVCVCVCVWVGGQGEFLFWESITTFQETVTLLFSPKGC